MKNTTSHKNMNQYRRKLLNAILYFSKAKVKYLFTTKTLKLLYFLDFTHVKQTGFPSIGLQYYAFKKGPVPKNFWLEIRDGKVPDDFKDALSIIIHRDELTEEKKILEFKAKKSPDMGVFTPREQKILERLAIIFQDAKAEVMSEASHLKNEPWEITFRTKGENMPIDYGLAIDDESNYSKEESENLIKEHFEVLKNFELSPTQ